jgi:L-asparaginase
MPEKYKVALLDCGGTISMTEEDGIAQLGLEPLNFDKVVHHSKYARDIDLITEEKVLCQDSSDAKPEDWMYIGRKVIGKLKKTDGLDGIVITHGTDTAADAVIALSYLLKKLPMPIVLTGSQMPARNPDKTLNYNSDAFSNLANSANVAAKSNIAECCLVFNNKIHQSENLIKKDAWDVDAFTNVNRRCIGKVKDDEIEIGDCETTRNSNKDFFIDKKFEPYKVGSLKIRPNLRPATLNNFMKNYYSVVLESFGGGNIPKRLIDKSVKDAVNDGKFIINCTQPRGIVDMSSGYSLGRDFLEAGKKDGDDSPLYVITGGDWTPSYAEIRMAYILGHKRDIKAVASKQSLDPAHLIHATFIAGVKFTNQSSRDKYKDITRVTPYPKNILHNNDFNDVIRTIANYQWKGWEL